MVKNKRFSLKLDKKDVSETRPPSPIEIALQYAEVLKDLAVVTKAQVARRFGVSRARVCQMLKLLKLDESILDYLKAEVEEEGENFFTERKLRPIAVVQDRNQQVRMFNPELNSGFLNSSESVIQSSNHSVLLWQKGEKSQESILE